jgi:hypothetical protein
MNSGHDEIAKLGAAISKQDFRDSFLSDPDGALKQHGVDKAQIPQELLDTMSSLSAEQLAALASVKETLQNHNVPPHITAQMV